VCSNARVMAEVSVFFLLRKSSFVCLMIIDNLKVLECWSSIVWIRQNKRHQNVFACEFANFRVSQTERFYNML